MIIFTIIIFHKIILDIDDFFGISKLDLIAYIYAWNTSTPGSAKVIILLLSLSLLLSSLVVSKS